MTTVGVLVHEGKTLGKGPEELRTALADAGIGDPPWCQVPEEQEGAQAGPPAARRRASNGCSSGAATAPCDAASTRSSPRTPRSSWRSCPPGTANLLAKALDIPIDLRGALDVALHGMPRPIDVGSSTARRSPSWPAPASTR